MWPLPNPIDRAINKILQGDHKMETPDVTKAQALSLCAAILNTLIAFGVRLTIPQTVAISGLYVVIVGILWSDHKIRNGRARIEEAAQFATTNPTKDSE